MKNLSIFWLCVLLSTASLSAQTWQYGNPNLADITATLRNDTLIFTGTGDMRVLATPPWSSASSTIRTVIINQGITNVSNYAFQDFFSLASVSLPQSVTAIGMYAFRGCSTLTSITLPTNLTSIGIYAFEWSGLTSITIPDNVTTVASCAFRYCPSLESAILPNNLTVIEGSLFLGCTALASVTLPANLSIIGGHSFYDCIALKSITIPNSVTRIDVRAFRNSGLTSIVIPESVPSIEQETFRDCAALTSVTINGKTHVGFDAFRSSGLRSLTFNGGEITIGESGFTTCSALESINFTNGAIIKTIGKSAFFGHGLKSLNLPEGLTSIGVGAFAAVSYIPNTTLTSVVLPNGLKTIPDEAFRGCVALASVTLPSDLTSIGASAFGGAAFTSIDLPQSLVTIGKSAFGGTGLVSIDIPNSVKTIDDQAFFSCGKLTSVNIGSGVTKIGSSAFANNYALTSITFDNPQMFGNTVGISTNPLTIFPQAFRNCTTLTAVNIPSHTGNIRDKAFENCYVLRKLVIEDGNSLLYLDLGVFTYAPIDTLYLGRSIKPLNNDPPFANNMRLKVLTLGPEITRLNPDDFYFCSLNEITVLNPVPPTIYFTTFANTDKDWCRASVPEGSLEAYRQHPVWQEFFQGYTVNPPYGSADIFAEMEEETALRVYPNPVDYELWIMNYEWKPGDIIELFDMNGKRVYMAQPNSQSSIVNSQFSIDMSSFPQGTYILRIGNHVEKIVKQ